MAHARSIGDGAGNAAGDVPGEGADRAADGTPGAGTVSGTPGAPPPDTPGDHDGPDAPGPPPARRERLLLVSTNYAPESAGIGPYAAQIAEDWVTRRGAEVHVLAGMPHYPAWRVDPAWRGRWRATELRDGVRVHRRRHTVPTRQTAVRRGLYEASILVGGLFLPPRGGRPDAILAQMPSLAGGVLAARLARRHGVPFVPVVQDLMGAAAAQSGIDGGGRAAAVATGLERRVLAAATLVGVIHESFRERVSSLGVPTDRIRLVPNWAHVARPTGTRADTRARLGWEPGRTVLLHSGNMGLKQGLEVLVETARLAPDLLVVLMGDGNRRAHLVGAAAGVPNLRILPPAGDAEFPDVLAAADALMVTQRASVLDMSVPSKLTSYFTAARPVIASVADGGGTAEEIRRSDAGYLVPPENPAAIVEAAREIAADPATADAIGARGFDYARTHLGREAGLARISALIDEALAVHRPDAPDTPDERKEATA
ncbi:glycosyltransferase family 4 protein [Streptomyces sp. ST2-7A]|uniref:glycosyltransferase family 4 protein n=1 Tax=Streptomyces sp. ST2-7A TaxID=2907214 RepID=UPI001F1FC1F5|nr:glycosyltransferase family 4 protein [Streptomyces sp. ST2-7A]MCE7081312.1 glycosyltransferase family 4 protein [Streptomyces sp. ST2-7A]